MGQPGEMLNARLTAEQAVALAKNADIPEIDKEDLCTAAVENKNGKAIWTATSLSKGSQFLVLIDDETKMVLESKREGVR